jgi:hypothetical protein
LILRKFIWEALVKGAIMSYEIALCKPERVKGIIVLGGRLPDGLESRIAKKEQLKNLTNIYCSRN